MSEPIDFASFASHSSSPRTSPLSSFRPIPVRLEPSQSAAFRAHCRDLRIAVIDAIHRQLLDLASVRLPSSESSARRAFIEETIARAGGRDGVGNWVYLPWEGKIAHLLAREDYFDVITNRNQDKLKREEIEILRAKRVGVIGLSVGGEAAVSVAQEHLCGEIRLADFDRLDLSNLNRLNAGFDELGENKAVIVARRIAKIDPYLPVQLFSDGVSEDNLESFLDGLDLVIEECDGLQIKWQAREVARKLGVNMVFAADERGFISVEPYGDQPELRPFHGRIAGPQPSRDSFEKPLDFFKVLTEWMGGWEQISDRSRRSLERVGGELCGYPQLASEARFAAGELGHVARRLLLGEKLPPFIGHIDLDDLVPGSGSASAG